MTQLQISTSCEDNLKNEKDSFTLSQDPMQIRDNDDMNREENNGSGNKWRGIKAMHWLILVNEWV